MTTFHVTEMPAVTIWRLVTSTEIKEFLLKETVLATLEVFFASISYVSEQYHHTSGGMLKKAITRLRISWAGAISKLDNLG